VNNIDSLNASAFVASVWRGIPMGLCCGCGRMTGLPDAVTTRQFNSRVECLHADTILKVDIDGVGILNSWSVQAHEIPRFLAQALDFLYDCRMLDNFVDEYIYFHRWFQDQQLNDPSHCLDSLVEMTFSKFHIMCKALASSLTSILCPNVQTLRPRLEGNHHLFHACFCLVSKVTFLQDMVGTSGRNFSTLFLELFSAADAELSANIIKFRESFMTPGLDVDKHLLHFFMGNELKIRRKSNCKHSMFEQSRCILEDLGTFPCPDDKCACLLRIEDSIWKECRRKICEQTSSKLEASDIFHRALMYLIASSDCSRLRLASTIVLLQYYRAGHIDFGRLDLLVAKLESAMEYFQVRNYDVLPFGSCPVVSKLSNERAPFGGSRSLSQVPSVGASVPSPDKVHWVP